MKRFAIRVHSGSSQDKIEEISDNEFEIWIKERPIEGKANSAIEKFLKKYLKKNIKIVKGLKSKNKVVEVFD